MRQIITTSLPVHEYQAEVLVQGDHLEIGTLVVHQPTDYIGRDRFVVEIRGNYNTIGRVVILGCADDESRESWKASVCSGLKITGNNNKIGCEAGQYLHLPYIAYGTGNRVGAIDAQYISGDAYNLCNHKNKIYRVDVSEYLDMFDYTEYHSDVAGMMYHKQWAAGEVLEGCEVWNITYHPSTHPFAAKCPQGFVADGVTEGCLVANAYLMDVHPEHAVSFADARNCKVLNIASNGAVNFDRKSRDLMSCDARGNCHL